MPPCRKLGSSRAAGSPARSCPSVVLNAGAAAAELPHRPERKMGRTVASRATERLHPRTQAKTRYASRTWRDTRPRAARAGSSRGRAPESLSGVAASFPLGLAFDGIADGIECLHVAILCFLEDSFDQIRKHCVIFAQSLKQSLLDRLFRTTA